MIIRQAVDKVSVIGRNTQGVRLISLNNEDQVYDITRIFAEDDDSETDDENGIEENGIEENGEILENGEENGGSIEDIPVEEIIEDEKVNEKSDEANDESEEIEDEESVEMELDLD